MKNFKRLLIIFCSIPVSFFQSCSPVQFSELASNSSVLNDLGGNGGTYGGKLSGRYLRDIPGFTCESRASAKAQIEFSDQGTISFTENSPLECGAVQETLHAIDLEVSSYQTDIIGYKEGIFEKSTLLSGDFAYQAKKDLVEVWCRDSDDLTGVETLIRYDQTSKRSIGRVYYGSDQGGNLIPKVTADFDVSRSLFPETIFSNSSAGFELKVFRDRAGPQDGQYFGQITTILDGQSKSRNTFCRLGGTMAPHNTQNYKIANVQFLVNAKETAPLDGWIDLQWETQGDISPSEFVMAYTFAPIPPPVSCQSGNLIPSAQIPNNSYMLRPLQNDVGVYIRICALDSKGQPDESRAVTLDVMPGGGYDYLTKLYQIPFERIAPLDNGVSWFVGDLNRDGNQDIVYHTVRNQFQVISGRDYSNLLSIPVVGNAIEVIEDYNFDGTNDFLVSNSTSGEVKIASGRNGAVLRVITGPVGALVFGSSMASLGDIDGDRVIDFYITSEGQVPLGPQLYLYSGQSGDIIYQKSSSAVGSRLKIEPINDFDGDGRRDYALLDGRNVSVFNRNHQLIRDFGNIFDQGNNSLSQVLALGDTNGDGLEEFAALGIQGGKRIIQILSHRTLIDQITRFAAPYISGDESHVIIMIGDRNGDGIGEYVTSGTSGEFEMAIVDGKSGAIIRILNNAFGSTFTAGAADVNNDGLLDILGGLHIYSLDRIFAP